MTGIDVLSNISKGGKSENTAPSKGKEISEGYENAAAVFAAVLNGRMNLYSNSEGQGSSMADQNLEEKQSNVSPVQSDQYSNGLESILGYGNSVLPFLIQMMPQSDFPAGKEANSGDNVSQGRENSSLAATVLSNVSGLTGKELEFPLLNLTSADSGEGLASTGMTGLKSQGNNLSITELDKYRQVIANLLAALSGEIREYNSDKNPLGVDGMATKESRQELARIIQGWMTDEAGEGSTRTSVSSSAVGSAGTKEFRQELAKLAQSQMTDEAGEGSTSAPASSSVTSNAGTKEFGQELAKLVQSWMTDEAGEGSTNAPASLSAVGSAGTKEFLQELAKLIQSQMTDEAGEGSTSTPVSASAASSAGTKDYNQLTQNGVRHLLKSLSAGSADSATPELNTEAVKLLTALYPILKEGAEGKKLSPGINEVLMSLKGNDLETIASSPKEVGFPNNVQSIPEGIGPKERMAFNILQRNHDKEVSQITPLNSGEHFETKDAQTQGLAGNSELNAGGANVVPLISADGKTAKIPVWEQISTAVREQVMSRKQEMKELDIQLHPAELGKIRIFLRWESGQVHLQVQASESVTGQLLQNQLSDLRQNLISQGVNCGSLEMGQNGGQQRPPGEESQRKLQQSTILSDEDENLTPSIHPLSIGGDGINRINVMA